MVLSLVRHGMFSKRYRSRPPHDGIFRPRRVLPVPRHGIFGRMLLNPLRLRGTILVQLLFLVSSVGMTPYPRGLVARYGGVPLKSRAPPRRLYGRNEMWSMVT